MTTFSWGESSSTSSGSTRDCCAGCLRGNATIPSHLFPRARRALGAHAPPPYRTTAQRNVRSTVRFGLPDPEQPGLYCELSAATGRDLRVPGQLPRHGRPSRAGSATTRDAGPRGAARCRRPSPRIRLAPSAHQDQEHEYVDVGAHVSSWWWGVVSLASAVCSSVAVWKLLPPKAAERRGRAAVSACRRRPLRGRRGRRWRQRVASPSCQRRRDGGRHRALLPSSYPAYSPREQDVDGSVSHRRGPRTGV